MKTLFNRLSLRMRITLLTGLVILAVSLTLTLVSMQNAGVQFNSLASQFSIDAIPPESELIRSDGNTRYIDDIPATASEENGEIMLDTRTAEAIRVFNLWSVLYLFLFSGVSMVLVWLLAGRALIPLRDLEAEVSEISAGNLSSQLPEPAMPDEVGRLTVAFNRMLNRLNQSFEQQKRFSSSVAHELKTPLATIKMSLQLARMEGAADEELLSMTERNVDRMTNVVGSLLELTNEIATGPSEKILLCPLLVETTKELMPLYEERNIHVSYDFSNEYSAVLGTPPLVRRLFSNLIENAFRYNQTDGQLHIGVSYDPGVGYSITIEDTGPGLPEEALPLLFEPFYCVDQSRSRKLGGAGLGLSIALSIAKQHGWTLSAANRTGRGALFTVNIPDSSRAD